MATDPTASTQSGVPAINAESIPSVDPTTALLKEPKVNELPPLSRVGYSLSKFILFIISGFILFLIVFLIFSKVDASYKIDIPSQPNIADSTFDRKLGLIKIIQEEKRSYREFIYQMSQMILLNLLLPILTAVLGYIFAKNENKG